MPPKKDEIYELYEQLKKRRIVLNKEEFARKLGFSRAQLHRIVTEDKAAKKALVPKAKELFNETKNVSRETLAKEPDAPYGQTITELLALLRMEKESLKTEQVNVRNAHDIIRILADKVKPEINDSPHSNNNLVKEL